jgi:hypothetical protein
VVNRAHSEKSPAVSESKIPHLQNH